MILEIFFNFGGSMNPWQCLGAGTAQLSLCPWQTVPPGSLWAWGRTSALAAGSHCRRSHPPRSLACRCSSPLECTNTDSYVSQCPFLGSFGSPCSWLPKVLKTGPPLWRGWDGHSHLFPCSRRHPMFHSGWPFSRSPQCRRTQRHSLVMRRQ